MTLLIAIGILFPFLSWLTLGLSFYEKKFHNRNASPIFIPFIGPIALNIAVILKGESLLWLPLPWLLDVGTLSFFYIMPNLIKDIWSSSPFNCVAFYEGKFSSKSAELSLFKNGGYLLKITMNTREAGVFKVNDLGTFNRQAEEILLNSHLKKTRRLLIHEETLEVSEEDVSFPDELSIKGFRLKIGKT